MNRTIVMILTFALLVIASFAVIPHVQAAPTGKWFDHIVTIAMENRDYSAVIGNPAAPFINSLAAAGAVFPAYHSYGAGNFAGDTIGGCSAGCYVALVSGSDLGISDGYACCLTSPTIVDQLQTAGLTWEVFCAGGCPRGNDHFPFSGFATIVGSPHIHENAVTTDLIAAANSPNPPNYLWYTPTDSENMHDNSVASGDVYIQDFLVGTGTVANPAPGSLLASSLFTNTADRTLLRLWWDEYDPSPEVAFGSVVKPGFTSSRSIDEFNDLRTIEDNWGIATPLLNAALATDVTDFFTTATSTSTSTATTTTLTSTTTTTSGPPPPSRVTFDFSFSPTNPTVGQMVNFTATVSGGTAPYGVGWDFGDGSINVGMSVTHLYATAGNYAVTAAVTDSSTPTALTATASHQITVGTSTTTSTTTTTSTSTMTTTTTTTTTTTMTTTTTTTTTQPPPAVLTATFTFAPSAPRMGLPTSFTSSVSGGTAPYTYSWSFGDGGISTIANPTWTYLAPGNFTVNLTVKDSANQIATSAQRVTIVSPPPPPPGFSVSFTLSPASPLAGQDITFTASETGGTGLVLYSWDFGDGGTGVGTSVTWYFASPGTYTVSLKATDASGAHATTVKTVTVTALPVAFSCTAGALQAKCLGSAISGTAPFTYTWNWGDGTTSTGQNATHTYAAGGSYSITLTVTDSSGATGTLTQVLLVESAHTPR